MTAAAITLAALALATPAAAPATAGAPFATISITAIGVRELVREGVSASTLDRGPGHYPSTGVPGRGGTIGIAAHRVTHTHPFLRLNELRRGQRIVLTRLSHRFVYRVAAMRILAPTDVRPLRATSRVETLVLTACHPPGTDLLRVVVFAERVAT